MSKKILLAFCYFWLAAPSLWAQTWLSQTAPSMPAGTTASMATATPPASALDAELFYRLLLGEITTREGDAGAGYALILDSARKTKDPQLYQRAVEIALQSRSGDAALQAAIAWRQAQPAAQEPNRYVLQILIALNRIQESSDALKKGIELAPAAERTLAISAIPRAYARASEKKIASSVVENVLTAYTLDPATAAAAWTTIGRMRFSAGDTSGALEAAKKGQTADLLAEGPVLVALDIMNPTQPAAEVVVQRYLSDNPSPLPEIRMAYARVLLDKMRYADAGAQLQTVIKDKPDFAPAWLVLGSLQLQNNQLVLAQTSFERYVALILAASQQSENDEPKRGLVQTYLSLAQIAEKRKDFAGAEAWINKIENSADMLQAQTRRASILASQGQLAEGRQLIRSLPERNPGDARLKLIAEISLLRDLKQHQLAYDLLAKTAAALPQDTDLLYDQAMMAEKLDQLPEMERLLRRVIAIKPDAYNAYNALGYSFADRNVRLPEAKALILKALEFMPNDPYIQDSLAWVEFRLGNNAEAAKIFAEAFKTKPDAEIAAHYGEVLWAIGQRDKALSIWREGQLLNPENETLVETLKRLKVKL
jgi:tetratricopeptide (TPR) repeat protein